MTFPVGPTRFDSDIGANIDYDVASADSVDKEISEVMFPNAKEIDPALDEIADIAAHLGAEKSFPFPDRS
jgi:hypothetical protein